MSPAIWRVGEAPSIVIVEQCLAANGTALPASIVEKRNIVRHASSCEGTHLVLADSLGRHRLWMQDRTGAHPEYRVVPDEWLDMRMAAIQALHESPRKDPNPRVRPGLIPTEYQKRRLKLLLDILDRLALTGNRATTREIATSVVYSHSEHGRAIEWKSSSARRQTQRLVSEARYMMKEGYRRLLKDQASARKFGGEPT